MNRIVLFRAYDTPRSCGSHAGETLGYILCRIDDGRALLNWIAQHMSGLEATAARILLDQTDELLPASTANVDLDRELHHLAALTGTAPGGRSGGER